MGGGGRCQVYKRSALWRLIGALSENDPRQVGELGALPAFSIEIFWC